jgi:SulP family sulfate permease
VIAGFATAAGFVIGTTQLTHLFGIQLDRQPTIFQTSKSVFLFVCYYCFKVQFSIYIVYQLLSKLDETNYVTLIIGVVGIVLLLSLKIAKKKFKNQHWIKFVPGALIVVVLFILICWGAGLYDLGDLSVAIVGEVPATFPNPTTLDFTHFSDLVREPFAPSFFFRLCCSLRFIFFVFR